MTPPHPPALKAAQHYARAIAQASAALNHPVHINPHTALDRSAHVTLAPPGLRSPNRACRLIPTADAWLAVNLPRQDDLDLLPAWLGAEIPHHPWRTLTTAAALRPAADMLAAARRLGLAVSIVGETPPQTPIIPILTLSPGHPRPGRPPHIIDLTSLWAGPSCAAILAAAGARVTRIESRRRPDPTRTAAPAFFARFNAQKTQITLDFDSAQDRHHLANTIATADLVITSARPRAFEALAITPAAMMARNPSLIWVAITGHGWTAPHADRIAFGDDAAAAANLLRTTKAGHPRFAGDALADPLAGLAAAAAALQALPGPGGILLDVALSRIAASAVIV